MPILLGLKGKTLMEADLGEKLVMAVCAALSMCGWGLALALGGFTVLKTMPGYVLFPMILFAYATALGTAIFGAFRLHARLGGLESRRGWVMLSPLRARLTTDHRQELV